MADYSMLFQAPNAGLAFAQGFQNGQQQRQADIGKRALAALAINPNNQQALAALANVDPKTAMAWRQQQAELVKQQLAEHQDNILKGAEIWRSVKQNHPDLPPEQQWQMARSAAQGMGLDISAVPQNYDENYANGLLSVADGLKPDTANLVSVTPQPGMPAFVYDKGTGKTTMVFSPNDGSHPAGAPVSSGPPPAAVAYLRAHPELRGQFEQKYGQGSAASILGNGGATGSAPSAPFPQ